jgi:hypothetical protein
MPKRMSKHEQNSNQLPKAILGPTIVEEPTEIDRVAISRFMAAMVRKAGKLGGKARAAKRTPPAEPRGRF